MIFDLVYASGLGVLFALACVVARLIEPADEAIPPSRRGESTITPRRVYDWERESERWDDQ